MNFLLPAVRIGLLRFLVLGTAQLLLIAGITIISISLPDIKAEMEITDSGLGILNAAYGVAFGGLILIGGRVPQRFSAHSIFIAGMVVWGFASLACGFAWNLESITVFRLCQGAGSAAVAPAAVVLLRSSCADVLTYNRAITVWGVVSSLGATVGILVSGVIAASSAWRTGFFVTAGLAVAVILLGARILPRPAPGDRERFGVANGLIFGVAFGLLTYGLLSADDHSLFACLAGALTLIAFVSFDIAKGRRFLPAGFFRDPVRVGALLSLFVASGAMATLFFVTSTWLQLVNGWPAINLAIAFVPFGLSIVLAAVFVSRSIRHLGIIGTLAVGLCLSAGGLLMAVPTYNPPEILALGVFVIFPFGTAIVFSAGTVGVMTGLDQKLVGPVAGLMNASMELGPAVMFAFFIWSGKRLEQIALGHGAEIDPRLPYISILTAVAGVLILLGVLQFFLAISKRTRLINWSNKNVS